MRTVTTLIFGSLLLSRASIGDPPGDELAERIAEYVDPYVRSNNFSGAILIARDGELLVRAAFGLADIEGSIEVKPETRFHIASVSKPFTAAAILILAEQGKLRVADPVARHIPDYPNGERITIHHLLTHTSGIPNVNDFPDYAERSRRPATPAGLVAWFRDKPLEFDPGARYRYSNSNYNLLAYLIELISGVSFGEFLTTQIFSPLGMTNTGHHADSSTQIPDNATGYVPVGYDGVEKAPYLDWSVKTGNGSCFSTVDDLLKWDQALRTGGFLSPESRARMFSDQGSGVGYGWFIRGGPSVSIGINGRSPGFTSSLERFPADSLTVIVLSNLYSGITNSMATDIAAIARGESREPMIPAEPPRAPADVLRSVAGRYRFGADFFVPNVEAEVRLDDRALILDYPGGGQSSLIPLPGNRYLHRLYGGVLRFERTESGETLRLVWNILGRDYPAGRIP